MRLTAVDVSVEGPHGCHRHRRELVNWSQIDYWDAPVLA